MDFGRLGDLEDAKGTLFYQHGMTGKANFLIYDGTLTFNFCICQKGIVQIFEIQILEKFRNFAVDKELQYLLKGHSSDFEFQIFEKFRNLYSRIGS
jgi:hypothetical protein